MPAKGNTLPLAINCDMGESFGLYKMGDDEGMMSDRLREHLAKHDVLILSGGVSKGKFDFVPKVLRALGVEEVFQQVAQQPGRPMWFGIGPQGQSVFGLPGNPVSTPSRKNCAMSFLSGALHLAPAAAALSFFRAHPIQKPHQAFGVFLDGADPSILA